jgi:hypothetical protein
MELMSRSEMIERCKSLLRPVVRHRALIERAKYIGTAILDPQSGNDRLADWLLDGNPRAVGKMGATELAALRRFEGTKNAAGFSKKWGTHRAHLNINAGVYPDDDATLSRFCDFYGRTLGELDAMAVWFQRGERHTIGTFSPHATPVALTALEPFYHDRPWSRHLAGKRVLVISPFAATIESQFARRTQIWPTRPEVLPAFKLDTLRCPLSAALVTPLFPSWFSAFEFMQQEMDRRSYDVLIVGAGAWSLPLVVHAKRRGKWAIHLGGGTQILFGIRGARWDDSAFLQPLYNDAWVRPNGADRPQNIVKIENGCYW